MSTLRFRRSTLGAIPICLLLAQVAWAQTSASAAALSRTLEPLLKSLSGTESNIDQMGLGEGLSTRDMVYLTQIESILDGNKRNAHGIYVLATIFSMMKSADDRKTVGEFLELHVEEERANCDSYSSVLNRLISRLSNPAALSEARHGRDLTQQICAAIRSNKGK